MTANAGHSATDVESGADFSWSGRMASREFLEDITLHLNANVFTRTFSFSSAQLPAVASPPPPLADHVVLVDGFGLVIDLCERKGRARLKSGEIEEVVRERGPAERSRAHPPHPGSTPLVRRNLSRELPRASSVGRAKGTRRCRRPDTSSQSASRWLRSAAFQKVSQVWLRAHHARLRLHQHLRAPRHAFTARGLPEIQAGDFQPSISGATGGQRGCTPRAVSLRGARSSRGRALRNSGQGVSR